MHELTMDIAAERVWINLVPCCSSYMAHSCSSFESVSFRIRQRSNVRIRHLAENGGRKILFQLRDW